MLYLLVALPLLTAKNMRNMFDVRHHLSRSVLGDRCHLEQFCRHQKTKIRTKPLLFRFSKALKLVSCLLLFLSPPSEDLLTAFLFFLSLEFSLCDESPENRQCVKIWLKKNPDTPTQKQQRIETNCDRVSGVYRLKNIQGETGLRAYFLLLLVSCCSLRFLARISARSSLYACLRLSTCSLSEDLKRFLERIKDVYVDLVTSEHT